jgi:dynein heavy chain 2
MLLGIVRNYFRCGVKMDNIFSFVSGRFMKIKKEDYLNIVKMVLVQFEREYKELIFVSTDESINYISSIEKVLSGSGHVMLVGCSGTGRRTSLILACLIQKLDIVTLNTGREFSVREFKKEMKVIIENCVNEKKKQVLFLEDHNFGKGEFIEMVNSLIISGEIPGLFTPEELERLPSAEELKKDALGISLHEAFCTRVS